MATASTSAVLNTTTIASELYSNTSVSNSTILPFSFFPPTKDLFLLPLRIVYRVEIFVFVTLPRQIFRLIGLESVAASLVGDTTGLADGHGFPVNSVSAMAATAGAGASGAAAADAATTSWFGGSEILQSLRKFGGFFSYMTSRWSLACIIVVCVFQGCIALSCLIRWRKSPFSSFPSNPFFFTYT